MTKSPDVRHRLSAISVSETGSPLRTGEVQPVPNSTPEQLNHASKPQLETTSDVLDLRADTYKTPSEPFSLSQEIAPTPPHRQMSITSNTKKRAPSTPSQPPDLSTPSWRKRQLQLLQQLGLPADEQQHNGSSQLHRRIPDIRSTWPHGPTPLRDLNYPIRSTNARLSYNVSTSYAPSSGPMSMNSRPLLPVTMSAAFAAEGWRPKLDPGVYGLSPSTSVHTDPDDFETHNEFKERLMNVLGQMMFVSGETAEASAETTGMIEEIVRAQVIEMVRCMSS